jgi:hypothetical protein
VNGRRSRSVLAAATVAAALIAGCGGDDPSDQPASNESAQAQTTTEEQGGTPARSGKNGRDGRKTDSDTNPELERCVKEAGDDPEAKYACLPPEPEPEHDEHMPEDKAFEECALAADTIEEKKACLEE